MIYFAIAGWLLAIMGWWGAWNVFQNLRIFIALAAQREQKLIQERITMVNNLQAAFDAAAAVYEAQKQAQVPNTKGSQTLN